MLRLAATAGLTLSGTRRSCLWQAGTRRMTIEPRRRLCCGSKGHGPIGARCSKAASMVEDKWEQTKGIPASNVIVVRAKSAVVSHGSTICKWTARGCEVC